ncbi:hypothetical protein N7462_001877 [Penicillium macrosclerotiorum]|uniref:uncharacterized protein n=1 Tax=Penicillium macrosclerotiorum TaxID=303699 RepID=UPI0025492D10|nr:uncharacterized protein N7462_001877 [Penicillium macrosclerotiorum]KAJ5692454.1 hypothetical protein N7462_001877 [Penicillium macrosclerotiorum]
MELHFKYQLHDADEAQLRRSFERSTVQYLVPVPMERPTDLDVASSSVQALPPLHDMDPVRAAQTSKPNSSRYPQPNVFIRQAPIQADTEAGGAPPRTRAVEAIGRSSAGQAQNPTKQ